MYFDCEGRGIGVEVSGGYRGSGADDGNRDLGGAHQETGTGRGSARERERLAGRRGSGVHLKFLELLHSVGLLAGRHLAGVVVSSLFAPRSVCL